MRVAEQTLAALEFPALLELVAHEAATDAGRLRILELAPTGDPDVLRLGVERGREAQRLLEDGSLVPPFERPFLPFFNQLAHAGSSLDGPDLLAARDLIATTRHAANRALAAEPPCPALAGLATTLPDLAGLERRLRSVLDMRGRIRDDASPILAQLRRRAHAARQRIYSLLQRYARSHRDEVTDDNVTLHQERLVVLLRSGCRRPTGLVHGRSASGQSLYFEPIEAVDLNNELREVHADEEAERQRLLRQLIDEVSASEAALTEHLAFLIELDLRQAAARWGEIAGATWALPAEDSTYVLQDGRHPLLDPRLRPLRESALGHPGHEGDIVPLTVELSPRQRVLIITGPNAGGKTVALKTLGLLALAAHCALPVPAHTESRIPRLAALVATVGDEQDLLADRSTFSARLLRLKEAWEIGGPATLVLLDELGSGTDPEEGAALGVALLEGLLERRALAAVTSHLTRLAAAALDLDGAACAAMAFDPESGRPTYRLVPGTPGASEALALARRLDLPAEWIDRADELLGADHGRLQRLLAEVETARDELTRQETQLAAERRRLGNERQRLEATRTELEEATRLASREARRAVDEFRRKVRKKLRAEVSRIEEAFASGRRRGLAAAAEERLFAGAPLESAEPSGRAIAAGLPVRHRALGWEGRVRSVARGRAEVVVAGKRVRCPAGDLEPLETELASPTPRIETTSRQRTAPAAELNLRGERVEAALDHLDGYLDQALLAGLREVRIIHGHGSGRLRAAVREMLDRHPAISSWRTGGRREGGDGATIVRLLD